MGHGGHGVFWARGEPKPSTIQVFEIPGAHTLARSAVKTDDNSVYNMCPVRLVTLLIFEPCILVSSLYAWAVGTIFKNLMEKRCYIIAGPNGARKTTFAKAFLPKEDECSNFVKAELITKGLSPFKPESVAVQSGRLMLVGINDVVRKGESFALETTLSGVGYARKLREWKDEGYVLILYYLWILSVELALERIALRVSRGGHTVPEDDVRRRFNRSWRNFQELYKNLVDTWVVFDNSGPEPFILDESE